jgi:hypothetical protein
MKVSDAPSIITRLDRSLIEPAAAKVRREFANAPLDGGELRKLAQDVWAIEDRLGLHTDGTAKGHYVFGVILVNDPGALLYVNGELWDAPPGSVYTLDGHRRHGLLTHNGRHEGLIGFLAWDIPRKTLVADLLEDLIGSIPAWVAGEERIDVLAQVGDAAPA